MIIEYLFFVSVLIFLLAKMEGGNLPLHSFSPVPTALCIILQTTDNRTELFACCLYLYCTELLLGISRFEVTVKILLL